MKELRFAPTLLLLFACACGSQEAPLAQKGSEPNLSNESKSSALPSPAVQQPAVAKATGGHDQPTLRGAERASRFPALKADVEHQQARLEAANLKLRGKQSFDMATDALPTTVRFSTSDRTTSFGTSPKQLLVSRAGAMVEERHVQPLAEHFSLRKWPSMKVVPSRLTVEASAAESPDALLTLVPQQPLASDIWYALVVDALPGGFEWSAQAPAMSTAGAKHVVRFMVGDQPVVSAVRVCGNDVYVDFSERMKLTGADDLQLSGAAAVGCKLHGDLGGSALTALLRCQSEPASFALTTRAQSVSGQSLDVASLDVTAQAMTEYGATGCRIFRP